MFDDEIYRIMNKEYEKVLNKKCDNKSIIPCFLYHNMMCISNLNNKAVAILKFLQNTMFGLKHKRELELIIQLKNTQINEKEDKMQQLSVTACIWKLLDVQKQILKEKIIIKKYGYEIDVLEEIYILNVLETYLMEIYF